MKRPTFLRHGILAAAAAAFLCSCASNIDRKCSEQLVETIERYKGAQVDTLVTLEVVTTHLLSDSERVDLMRNCELLSAERLDSHMMITCTSNHIACLADSPLVVTVQLAQPWSPDL